MDANYQTMLNRFQSNYLDYKLTGQESYKVQYLAAENWLNRYIQTLQQTKQQNNSFIQQFTNEYATTNKDIVDAQGTLKMVKEKGPELQDTYETLKEVNEDVPTDYSQYYTKALVLGGLLAIVGVLNAL